MWEWRRLDLPFFVVDSIPLLLSLTLSFSVCLSFVLSLSLSFPLSLFFPLSLSPSLPPCLSFPSRSSTHSFDESAVGLATAHDFICLTYLQWHPVLVSCTFMFASICVVVGVWLLRGEGTCLRLVSGQIFLPLYYLPGSEQFHCVNGFVLRTRNLFH